VDLEEETPIEIHKLVLNSEMKEQTIEFG